MGNLLLFLFIWQTWTFLEASVVKTHDAYLQRMPKCWAYKAMDWTKCTHTHEFIATTNLNKANLRDLIAATNLVISNWIQIIDFSARVTAKFDEWSRKTIEHFFYTELSFVHHFKSIGEFKPELQSRNTQFGSKLVIFCCVWPWNLMDDLGKHYGTSSILHQAFCIISNPSVKSN